MQTRHTNRPLNITPYLDTIRQTIEKIKIIERHKNPPTQNGLRAIASIIIHLRYGI
jgi:hypothetical protein